MVTKLIELEDGTLIEVEALANQPQEISGGLAEKVSTSFAKIQPVFLNVCRPIINAWQKIDEKTKVEQVEIDFGFSFEGEGNVYITKAKTNANVHIKIVLKPKVINK